MEPIDIIRGTMAPLPRSNVDTDQIIPKQFLKRVERSGFGPYLFYDWAQDDPDFVLNKPEYEGASVLVTGPNFGSGSSREHAPWAIEDRGFRAIIAPSFADIFRNNCVNVGILTVELKEPEVNELTRIAESAPSAEVEIDLQEQLVTAPNFQTHFHIDAFDKHRLLNGLDQIALTLQHAGAIDDFEGRRPSFKPTLG
jgi:3-isopropylmalate/(R)-2-methylmalate dehydratase small subunit